MPNLSLAPLLLRTGSALMPFAKVAPGQQAPRPAAATAQHSLAAERQRPKAAAAKVAPQQQPAGLGPRAASGSGRKQWSQQPTAPTYASKQRPAGFSGEDKKGAAAGQQLCQKQHQQGQQQQRQQEHERQRQLLMAAVQLAAQWVEQQGATSPMAASGRSGVRHASPAHQARTQYEKLLKKATEQADQQLQQQEKQRQQQQQQKDRGPGMLMFRWSRRFSSTGASVDLANPSISGSSRPASEAAVQLAARELSPRASRRLSTATDSSEQPVQKGGGRNQSRRRADDGTAASRPSYTHFSCKQQRK